MLWTQRERGRVYHKFLHNPRYRYLRSDVVIDIAMPTLRILLAYKQGLLGSAGEVIGNV